MAGPYRWDRYDVLVMPRAFAFGGMENPRLSFVSPSIVAGDRSLVVVVVHELAHSWSGNLVTNATWNDFWLNEGFTTYLEHRLIETLYGERRAQMEDAIAYEELVQDDQGPHGSTGGPKTPRCTSTLAGRDPDEGISDVAYQQGPLVPRLPRGALRPARVRRVPARVFRRACVPEHDTARFRAVAARVPEATRARRPSRPDEIDAWIYGPGLPATMPKVAQGVFDAVDSVAADWRAGRIATDATAGEGLDAAGMGALPRRAARGPCGRKARGIALRVPAGRRRQCRDRAELAASS